MAMKNADAVHFYLLFVFEKIVIAYLIYLIFSILYLFLSTFLFVFNLFYDFILF